MPAGYALYPGSHIDAPLSDYLAANRAVGSIADEVSPIVPVRRRSDLFYTWDKAALLGGASDDSRRSRGSEPTIIEPTSSVDGFVAVEFELATMIEDSDLPNTDDVLQLEMVKTTFLQDRLRLQREARVAARLRLAANSGDLGTNGTTNAGANQWDNASFVASDLIKQITVGIEAVRTQTGHKPNTIVIPAACAAVAVRNTAVQALIQYVAGPSYLRSLNIPLGGSAFPGNGGDQLAGDFRYFPQEFLGMRVLEPSLVTNTAGEGLTASYSDLWGKDVRIMYVQPGTPHFSIPSAMYTFRSTEYGTAGWNVRTWRDEGAKATKYGVGIVEVDKVVAPEFAYVIAAAVS